MLSSKPSFIYSTLCMLFLALPVSLFGQDKGPTEKFLEFLQEKNYAEAYPLLSETTQTALSKNAFEQAWGAGLVSLGNMKGYRFNCKEEAEQGETNYYEVSFERMEVMMRLGVEQNGGIKGFVIVQDAPCNNKYIMPSYGDANLFADESMSIPFEDIQIQASVMRPKSSTLDVVCILTPGSGPQDRDASIGPNKPFKDLAIGLAVNGIASIRYDKASLRPTRNGDNYMVDDEYTDGILAIVNYIKQQEEFKGSKIVLIGHSLGAMLAPSIAQRSEDIVGSVSMAANFRPLEDLILEQSKYLLSLNDSLSEVTKEIQIKMIEGQVVQVKNELDTETGSNLQPLGIPASYWLSLKPYYLHNNKTKRKLKKPMLVLWGEKDYQVGKVDFDMFQQAYRKKATFRKYPTLNHPFLESSGTMSPDEYAIQGNIPQYVIDDIVAWIKTEFKE